MLDLRAQGFLISGFFNAKQTQFVSVCVHIQAYIQIFVWRMIWLESACLGRSVQCGPCDHHSCFPSLQVLLPMASRTRRCSSSEQLLSSSVGWATANGKWWQIKHCVFLCQLSHCRGRARVPCCYQLDKMYCLFSTARLGCGVGDACLFITVEPFKMSRSLVK